jgi:hypothetical protein
VGREDLSVVGRQPAEAGIRDVETIDAELRRVAAFRRVTRELGGPPPLMDVADALLDERLQAHRVGYNPRVFSQFPSETSALDRCRVRRDD